METDASPRTRAEYLVEGYDESLAIVGRLLDWRIAAVWLLISGIMAWILSYPLGGVAILPEAIGLLAFGIVRSRRARRRYARLRAILAEGEGIGADPVATSHLPVYRIDALDAQDLDELDRRLRIRGQDRLDAAADSRDAQRGALAFLVVSFGGAFGLFLSFVLVFTAHLALSDRLGALIICMAVLAPTLLAFRELSAYLSWGGVEARTTLAHARVRLEQLRGAAADYAGGEVIVKSGDGLVIDPDRMRPSPADDRVRIVLRAIMFWGLLALFVLLVTVWIVNLLTTVTYGIAI